jgi:molybdopterin-containing oxidoreductase family iron-sulfur binding subunit
MSDLFKILQSSEPPTGQGGPEPHVALRPMPPTDLAKAREALAGPGKDRFWQSLQELAGTSEYQAHLHHEFPHDPEKSTTADSAEAGGDSSHIDRRDILKLMAASAALSGLSACTKLPTEKIVPYVRAPEEIIPGKPLFYATSMPLAGGALGLLVESHMGRPTKIEGNAQHPASLGSTDIFAQASILTMYDPDRSQVVLREGRISEWAAFLNAIADMRTEWQRTKGVGLRILTGETTSPTFGSQMKALLEQFPEAKWYAHEPTGPYNSREGARLVFGKSVNSIYHFDHADVVLSLDSDFLSCGPGNVRHSRDFSARRRVNGRDSTMNRLYVVESTPTNTGVMADHRLPLQCSAIEGFARALASSLGVSGGGAGSALAGIPSQWISALALDLQQNRGSSLIVAGDAQPPAVHALAHAMNQALGNAGKTVTYAEPVEVSPENDGLADLVKEIDAGQVTTLAIIGSNPVYSAPVDLGFAQKLLKVGLRVHVGLYNDETAELCHWHVPEAHFLEAWGDCRTYDGTASIIQPLIMPLYNGRSWYEIVGALSGEADRAPHDVIQEFWRGQHPSGGNDKAFRDFWETSLHDGVIAGSAAASPSLSTARSGAAATRPAASTSAIPAANLSKLPAAAAGQQQGLEVIIRPDSTIGDGRWSNNGWLQELPKPLIKISWDNTVLIAPATADRLGVDNEDVVRVRTSAGEIQGPIFIMPGHPKESITLQLGFGRRRAGHVGNLIGYNAYLLRTSGALWFTSGGQIEKTGKKYPLATTQHHHLMEHNPAAEEESENAFDRRVMRVGTLHEFYKNPEFAADHEEDAKRVSLYPDYKYEGYAWGMSIDLNSCNGCGACVVACQSENNISVVGKGEVANGRDMQWIRVDNYFRGDLDNPEMYYEPVPCQQCENAPCELVCPVGATVHSPEGLNEMIYNRCVGTRYCSNNCPYKVRRFNFYLYSDWTTQSLYGMRNPNVSVRSRGVMEKCSYCVQRINAAKIESEKEDRQVRDGEIVTACQAVCPAEAIVFGNINDPNSKVSKLKAQSRNYTLMPELNTRPRTTYLAKLKNPNPALAEG